MSKCENLCIPEFIDWGVVLPILEKEGETTCRPVSRCLTATLPPKYGVWVVLPQPILEHIDTRMILP